MERWDLQQVYGSMSSLKSLPIHSKIWLVKVDHLVIVVNIRKAAAAQF